MTGQISKQHIPLSVQGKDFRFYCLFQHPEELALLKFVPKGQIIVHPNDEAEFQHKLGNSVWKIAVKCKWLGDGYMDEEAALWVRVYEVGTERIEDDGIKKALVEYWYWKNVQKAVFSNPKILGTCDLSWKEYIIERLGGAEEELFVAIKTWVKSLKTTVEKI